MEDPLPRRPWQVLAGFAGTRLCLGPEILQRAGGGREASAPKPERYGFPDPIELKQVATDLLPDPLNDRIEMLQWGSNEQNVQTRRRCRQADEVCGAEHEAHHTGELLREAAGIRDLEAALGIGDDSQQADRVMQPKGFPNLKLGDERKDLFVNDGGVITQLPWHDSSPQGNWPVCPYLSGSPVTMGATGP